MVPWIAAAGAFVVSLDSSVNVAFPAMAAALGAPPERMRWVILAYVFTYALTSFAGGAAGDRAGLGRVFTAGMALNALGLGVAGSAPTFGWLLLGRMTHGVGGGLVYGTAPALMTLAAAPEARGRAVGFLNGAIGAALVAGPLLAGALVGPLGWRVVFHGRLPLALAVAAWALVALPPARAGLGARRVAARDLARASVLRAGTLAFLANGGVFAVWLLAPFYLVTRRQLEPWLAGALFTLTPLGTALAAPLAGRLADRIGPRRPVLAGLGVEATGLLLMAQAGPETPLTVVGTALLAAGSGLGLMTVPNMAALMGEFPAAHQGAAGGLAFLARTLGIVAGVVVTAQVFAARRPGAGFDAAFAEAFLAASVLVLAGIVLAAWPAAGARARGRR